MSDEKKQKVIQAQIERTLKRYEGKATPDMLRAMREQLEELLTTHPVATGLVEQLQDYPIPIATDDGAEPGAKAGGGEEGA
jgi:hypothetical protein